MIADLSQREEYRPTAESQQALNDLTITARVEAALLASSGLRISNLTVETRRGEVHVGGTVLAEELKETAADTIRKIPGVVRVKTSFVITAPDAYVYGDGR
jgi:osmotically-inducible protein OsmY